MKIHPEIQIDIDEVLRYMGQGTKDEVTHNIAQKAIDKIQTLMEPRYTFAKVNKSQLSLDGNDICEHLFGCEQVYILVATLGVPLDRQLRLLQYKSMIDALALDSAATDALEKLCDKAQIEIIQIESKNYVTGRYSPGYGDFPLDIQPKLIKLTDASKKIGLTVNQDNLLIPKKSVTALLGVSSSFTPGKIRGCNNCNLSYRCTLKKLGGCNNAKRPNQK